MKSRENNSRPASRGRPEHSRPVLPDGSALIRPPTATRAALWLGSVDGSPAVFKDYSRCSAPMRPAGRFLLRRERAIYSRLAGIPGIPRCFGLVGPYCLAVERIPGKDALQFERGELPKEFFDRLDAMVEELHRRGIVHCDLKHRQNIVVTPDHRPYIVDFATALTPGSRWNFLRRWAFRIFVHDDRKALVKIRYYLGVGQVSEAHWRLISHHSGLERAARRVREVVREVAHALIGYHGAGYVEEDIAPSRRRPGR